MASMISYKLVVGLTQLNLNSQSTEYIDEHHTTLSRLTRILPYQARRWKLRDRLSERKIVQLIMAYKTGIATKDLAEQYGINVKSVRKILREYQLDKWMQDVT